MKHCPKGGEHGSGPAETKHTPGPWRVTRRGNDSSIPFGIEAPYRGSWQAVIAIADLPPDAGPHLEANARLIALAPEMADTLLNVLEGLEAMEHPLSGECEIIAANVKSVLRMAGCI